MIKDIWKFYFTTLLQWLDWADTSHREENTQTSAEEGSTPFSNSLLFSNLPVGKVRKVSLTTTDSASLIIRINLPLKFHAENSVGIVYASLILPEKHEARNPDLVIRPVRIYDRIEKLPIASYDSVGDC